MLIREKFSILSLVYPKHGTEQLKDADVHFVDLYLNMADKM